MERNLSNSTSNSAPQPAGLNRRCFLQLSSLVGVGAASGILWGCAPAAAPGETTAGDVEVDVEVVESEGSSRPVGELILAQGEDAMIAVVGHRGAAGIAPENTLKGFRRAIELGVDRVECDVHLTRDNYLVVMHDSTVDRTTNGQGAIRDLTLARIRELDAGEEEQVPTLDEVLETVRGKVHLICELKGTGVESAAVQAVRGHGMVEEVTFTSFVMTRLAAVRALGERYRVGPILPDPSEMELEQAVALNAEGIGVHYRNIALRTVEDAHARGLEIRAWNPDTWREQALMIAMGVDDVSTNRPDILLANLPEAPEPIGQ